MPKRRTDTERICERIGANVQTYIPCLLTSMACNEEQKGNDEMSRAQMQQCVAHWLGIGRKSLCANLNEQNSNQHYNA